MPDPKIIELATTDADGKPVYPTMFILVPPNKALHYDDKVTLRIAARVVGVKQIEDAGGVSYRADFELQGVSDITPG